MEIERKYLVDPERWLEHRNPTESSFMQQGYLSADPRCTVRIRMTEKNAKITIKGETRGISREEFEYSIPFSDAVDIIKLSVTPLIIKRRYRIKYEDFWWDVDEFFGDNEGLVLAEVELDQEGDMPAVPPWAGAEVSEDPRYMNLALALNPINSW